ncbi:helix-turn-helix transcriptional regulator [Fastidiosibacter lacustris]|uniref:helix-turn-helix transcriptional regulator n=1 Tax=Fastidiosibacter lacustris TaxID=2056695 RepID=UPI000E34FD77|nr:helix-turn-helix transcriptional regulator [Fastidiosibacter lacustris]
MNKEINYLNITEIDAYPQILNLIRTNLKIYMYQNNVNSVELSKELGISTGTVSKIINGKCNPTILILLAITNYLEIKINDLLKENTSAEKSYEMIFSKHA